MKSSPPIPVLKPAVGKEEIDALAEVIDSGWLGLGPKTEAFERALAAYFRVPGALALNSGTAALHLALSAAGIKPGDQVLVPAITFVSTAHVVRYLGAEPVFVDVDPIHLNMDPEDASRKITDRTTAVIPVHMAGHPCPMRSLESLSNAHGLTVIEDAAHACGATYRGQKIGSISTFTCFSFHAVKNLTCGEGGAILGPNLSGDVLEQLRRLRWLGISRDTWNRSHAKEGYAWQYEVQELGFKCHMSDLNAAVGLVQLRKLERHNARRRELVDLYAKCFSHLDWIKLPVESIDVHSAWHLYQVRLPSERIRDRFIKHMADRGIATGIHYFPVHLHPIYRNGSHTAPVAEAIWSRIVSLPLYPSLSVDDLGRIIESVQTFEP